MKQLLCIGLLSLLVTACASNSPYHPAQGSGYGYQETRISEDRFRVSFMSPRVGRDEARDFALLRAAELTLLEGYDWFVVADRETVVDRERSAGNGASLGVTRTDIARRDCGLVGCRTTYYPRHKVDAGVSVGADRKTVESVLEIRLGTGVRPASGDSYDAREVRDNLVGLAGK